MRGVWRLLGLGGGLAFSSLRVQQLNNNTLHLIDGFTRAIGLNIKLTIQSDKRPAKYSQWLVVCTVLFVHAMYRER